MRAAAIVTAVAGVGIVAGLVAAGGKRLEVAQTDVEPTTSPSATAREPAVLPQPTPNPEASMNARPVDDASQFYPAVVGGKPLERIAAPVSAKPKAVEDKGVDLARPIAESAGVVAFGDRRLLLAGVNPTPADRTCTDTDGRDWPCGMLAKTNFRLFLRLRTVNCDIDDAQWTGTVTAACKIGTQDLSRWLVENGWAAATGGSELADAGENARQARKGIYGGDPRNRTMTTEPDVQSPDVSPDPL
ncbi:thermonuclease family protein [Rhizobium sp. Root1220]|uniref:thermonuclease family protein n=1 Tax=Rhizobium sp. Root1220 TaxID=1736432 RepID=UPI0006FCED21|nr:thermonuclease family protein [Rhizobium sp. Root1220]KQV84034.1 hypothetical protein ASC90_00455 [Rhizobium sp. Root1220]